jgi:LysW-gamma-L-alpha-aminoadipyl-6-phosphate/LysW-L-glutamyl-5-phosphate reductase
MSKRFKAAVIGGSGYGGGELIRRLLLHPHVELTRVASVDFIGEALSAAHPNLEGLTDLKFDGITPAEAAKAMDVVLLGLPHKVSATKMPELIASGARIVDLSGDFRLRDAALYKRYYHADHPSAEKLTDGTFVYGLPELHREKIKAARYVASPGCFATTIELALLPLAKAGLLDAAGEGRPSLGRSRSRGHHRVVGQRRRSQRRHPPSRSRSEPPHVQAARSSAHPRDHADAR